MVWYDVIWYDMIWCNSLLYDMIWYGMIWYTSYSLSPFLSPYLSHSSFPCLSLVLLVSISPPLSLSLSLTLFFFHFGTDIRKGRQWSLMLVCLSVVWAILYHWLERLWIRAGYPPLSSLMQVNLSVPLMLLLIRP